MKPGREPDHLYYGAHLSNARIRGPLLKPEAPTSLPGSPCLLHSEGGLGLRPPPAPWHVWEPTLSTPTPTVAMDLILRGAQPCRQVSHLSEEGMQAQRAMVIARATQQGTFVSGTQTRGSVAPTVQQDSGLRTPEKPTCQAPGPSPPRFLGAYG